MAMGRGKGPKTMTRLPEEVRAGHPDEQHEIELAAESSARQMLDERRVGEIELQLPLTPTSTTAGDAVATVPRLAKGTLHVLFFICAWYCVSITITLYNKWLFSVFGMPFPLLITSVHIGFKIPLSRLLMRLFGMPTVRFRSWRTVLLQVAPAGLAMVGDIGLSNLALLHTTVTYYTIVKSSVPLWIMCFSALYGLLRVRADLVIVLLFIAGGISLASSDVLEEDPGPSLAANATAAQLHFNSTTISTHDQHPQPDTRRALAELAARQLRRLVRRVAFRVLANATDAFAADASADAEDATMDVSDAEEEEVEAAELRNDFLGAVLVLGASMCAGFRWACTQMLMAPQRSAEEGAVRSLTAPQRPLLNPVTLLYYTSPFGLLGLLPFALAKEAAPLGSYLSASSELPLVCLLVLAGAGLGFVLLLTELKVVQLASGLTLSVAGIFKEVLTVLASAWLLGDELTLRKMAGLAICLLGIALYNRSRMKELEREAPQQIDR